MTRHQALVALLFAVAILTAVGLPLLGFNSAGIFVFGSMIVTATGVACFLLDKDSVA